MSQLITCVLHPLHVSIVRRNVNVGVTTRRRWRERRQASEATLPPTPLRSHSRGCSNPVAVRPICFTAHTCGGLVDAILPFSPSLCRCTLENREAEEIHVLHSHIGCNCNLKTNVNYIMDKKLDDPQNCDLLIRNFIYIIIA